MQYDDLTVAHETNVVGLLTEALAANVKAILADKTALVTTYTADTLVHIHVKALLRALVHSAVSTST